MSVAVDITTNAPAVAAHLEHALRVIAEGTRNPDIAVAFKRVGARMLGFQRRRFLTFSRSGGNAEWPDLAISTKIRRLSKTKTQRKKLDTRAKKEKKASRAALLREIAASVKLPILVDTSTLLNSLSTGATGNIDQMLPDGVRVGSRVKYAAFHDDPPQPGRPPRRRIIAPPDTSTLDAMRSDVETGVMRAVLKRFNAN